MLHQTRMAGLGKQVKGPSKFRPLMHLSPTLDHLGLEISGFDQIGWLSF